MIDRGEEVAKRYLDLHLEPPGNRKAVDITSIQNPNDSLSRALLEKGQVHSRFFEVNGRFTKINPAQYIDQLVAEDRENLRIKKDGVSIDDYVTANSKLKVDTAILELILRTTGNLPVVIIDQLSVKGNERAFDFQAALPGYTFIWNPGGNHDACFTFPNRKMLNINTDISSPEGLLFALHEIEHGIELPKEPKKAEAIYRVGGAIIRGKSIKDLEEKGKKSKDYKEFIKGVGLRRIFIPGNPLDYLMEVLRNAQENVKITNEDMRIYLEAERDAWAFALRTISGLIKDRTVLGTLQQYIHEDLMKRQSDDLRLIGFVQNTTIPS